MITSANIESGEIEVRFANPQEQLALQVFPSIIKESSGQISKQALERSYPFETGQRFDQRLLEIASRRLRSNGLLNYSKFRKVCGPGAISIFQHYELLKPKKVRIGIGFNSEKGPLFLAGWKNSRLSSTGSSLEALLEASLVQQTLNATHRWYLDLLSPFAFLKSQFEVSNENDGKIVQRKLTLSSLPSMKFDHAAYGFEISLGPSAEFTRFEESGTATDSQYISVENKFSIWSHDYEYTQGDPGEGFSFNHGIEHTAANWGLGFSLTKLDFTFKTLKKFGPFAFEHTVLGLRGQVSTTANHDSTAIGNIPPDLRSFLGGSENFRGFGRNDLPRLNTGSLSSAYAGTELRFLRLLPLQIQPILFVDFATLSQSDFSFGSENNEVYWAPGIGLRWNSPLGPLRFTLAWADGISALSKDTSNSQFTFSFGEEF